MRMPPSLLVTALAALAGCALAGCGEQKAIDQPVVALKGDSFTVAMPGTPKREVITAQTAAGPVPLTTYITEGGSEGYAMTVLKIPHGVKGDLLGAVRGAAKTVDGTVEETRRTTFQGYPARDARIAGAKDSHGNKGTLFARVILARGRLFQLQFVTDGADVQAPPPQYSTFVSSLRIG